MSKKARKRFWRRRRHDAAFAAAWLLAGSARVLPRSVGLRLWGWVAAQLPRLIHRDRSIIIEQATRVLGRRPGGMEPSGFAREVFGQIGANLFDALYLSRCSDAAFHRLVHHGDLGPFRAAYEKKKGVIVITAHLGCFESLLQFYARHGFKSFAIGRNAFDPRIDRLMVKLRSGPNIAYLDRTGSARSMLKLLNEGRAMGVLIDQDTRVEGVFAHFLDSVAYTPSAPMRMAMKFGIPVVVSTTARQSDGTHAVTIHGPLELADTGDFTRDLVSNVETVNGLISQAIHQNPEQWVWMHRRWRRRPEDPGMEDVPNIERL